MDKNKQIRKERYVPEFDPSTTAKRDCLRCKYLHLTASQCFSVCRRAYEELQAENEELRKGCKATLAIIGIKDIAKAKDLCAKALAERGGE